ncbi:retrograde regulation protein 2 [Aspergillus ellipticus CBS 707.79]|uniref:Retrograde regulation protein 2 n=1 Tax=Aspergillus ellipticus CBS 707.79 TaxID=1448320 RepID=A0A319DAQ6_9EURO|nr:retrograde regulation protein 2 [Aspergillus ellipticus CBS 707.79]
MPAPPGAKKSRAERRLLLKADLVILPLASLGYLVAYLDRNNLGNAKVMGLITDLHLSANQYYNCLTMLYVGYMIVMLPANLALRKLKANRAIGTAIVFFGIIMCCLSTARTYSVVMALRFLMGTGQAFIQGLTMYTSLWYRRDELGTRSAIYYSLATLSGALGGLIAYGVEVNPHLSYERSGRYSWAWLFLIEGVIAVGVGLLVIIFLPHTPDDLIDKPKHWLFTHEDIKLGVERQASYNTAEAKFAPIQLRNAFLELKTWLFATIQGANVLGLAVAGNFLPSLIQDFGFSALQTQLFTVVPYACAFACCITLGILSDKVNRKAPVIFFTSALAVIGYIMLLSTASKPVGITAACLITMSCYTNVVLTPVWLVINTLGYTKRSTVWAFSEVWAMCFSIMATRIYTDPPRYIKGHSVVLALNVLALVDVVLLAVWMHAKNRAKERVLRECEVRGEVHPHIRDRVSFEDVQDGHVAFRYIL